MKQYSLVNRLLAALAFVITLVTYVATLQPSVPFWDCGEFTAATTWQQVPHPPGAPFWLIVARVFQMLIPSGDLGWRVNLFSAVCSAATAALVYLIVVKLIERWHPYQSNRPLGSYIGTFAGGLIGTLAFTWSDTQWFNSVESEVYAGGTALIALLMYLMMRWDEESQNKGHERYILLMAYVVGVAFGVHLLALLVVPAIAMVIYFRNYEFKPFSFGVMIIITGAIFFLVVYKGPLEYIPKMLAGRNLEILGITIKSDVARVLGILTMLGLLGLLWWSVKERKPKVFLSVSSFLLILLGFTSYTQILIRANAHPPMNENEPDHIAEVVSYLGREQYGNAPNWPRRYKVEQYHRQYQDQYGEWYEPTDQKPDGSYVFDKINTGGELNFMWSYQINHMYLRYLLWNFVGRVSDVQDANWLFVTSTDANPTGGQAATEEQIERRFIKATGYPDVFPVQFLALPLLLGLFGLYYHYKRDWKMALVFTALFLLLGVLATLQQNQQQPQPRERDYFYVGSFMVFAIWIGIGATGLGEMIRERKSAGDEEEKAAAGSGMGMTAALMGVCFIAVPLNMAYNGWRLHDRSHNWVPWDYAYNILQSCEKDAILFTNGDNDTFPLWYMQDVAGVRRDVRIVNLSLGNTLWYVWQLKNERPWGAKTVPISFPSEILSDDAKDKLNYTLAPPKPVKVDVPATVMSWATNGRVTQAGTMTWTLHGEDIGRRDGQLIRVQDKLIEDIIRTNKWERPIYFSSSVQPSEWTGLDDYMLTEGLAMRVMPVKQGSARSMEAMNYEVTKKCLMNTLGADEYFTEPHYGFQFRDLSNPKAFFLEDHRRLIVGSFIPAYRSLAIYELYKNRDSAAAIAVLNKMQEQIPSDLYYLPYYSLSELSTIYDQAGDKVDAKKYAERAIAQIDAMGTSWTTDSDPAIRYYYPVQVKTQMYVVLGEFDKAIDLYDMMYKQAIAQKSEQAPQMRSQLDELRIEKHLSAKDTTGAVAELRTLIEGYASETAPAMLRNRDALRAWLTELTGVPDNTNAADSSAAGVLR